MSQITNREGKTAGAPLVHRWPEMEIGESFEAETAIAHVGNNWAERNSLDWRFSSKKLGFRKYEIKRIK